MGQVTGFAEAADLTVLTRGGVKRHEHACEVVSHNKTDGVRRGRHLRFVRHGFDVRGGVAGNGLVREGKAEEHEHQETDARAPGVGTCLVHDVKAEEIGSRDDGRVV